MINMRMIICPFCDCRIKSDKNVIKCRNCGEAFEPEPDEEEFLAGHSAHGFSRF